MDLRQPERRASAPGRRGCRRRPRTARRGRPRAGRSPPRARSSPSDEEPDPEPGEQQRRTRASGPRVATRCWSHVPPIAPDGRGDADDRGRAGLHLAAQRVGDDADGRDDPDRASEVAVAGRGSKCANRSSSGTITIPPPTPKSALKNPAARPIRTKRSTRLSFQPWTRRSSCGGSRPTRRGPRSCSTSTACSRRSSSGRRTRRCRTETRARARAARRAVRARRRASRGRPSDDARRVVGVDGLTIRRRARPRARAGGGGVGRPARRVRSTRSRWPAERKRLTAASTTARTRRPLQAPEGARRGRGARAPRRASGRAGGGWCWRSGRPSTRTRARRCGGCSTQRGLRRALYAGDDTTDLDAFRGARRARARGARGGRVGGGAAAARGRGRPRPPRPGGRLVELLRAL